MVRSSKTPAQRRALISKWRRSGLPAARFARLQDIHPRTFWGWIRDARPPAPDFVPIRVLEAAQGPVSAADESGVEIVLPAGVIIRVRAQTSPAWTAALVRELRGAC